jgi:dTDP-4-dehydrorhamnose reductase
MSRILVFGRTGQVAQELQRLAPVVSLDRSAVDLSEPESCAAAIHANAPSVVINAAAYTAVDRAEDEEALATKINGSAPAAMAQACAQRNIPLLHLSTDYVFAGSGKQAWTPSAATKPINAYGRSKLAGELAIRNSGAKHIILRTAWVFSAHGSNFVKTMLRLAENHPVLRVVSDQHGGPTSARSLAQALLQLSDILQDGADGGTYHMTGTPATTWSDFARAIFSDADLNTQVIDITSDQYPTPAARPANSVLDCTTLTDDFGIMPPDWHADLRTTLKELGAIS